MPCLCHVKCPLLKNSRSWWVTERNIRQSVLTKHVYSRLSVHVVHFAFILLQLVTVVFQRRLLMGRSLGKTLATETQWFISATLDSGSLAPQYGSASRTTAGLGCSQFVFVSTSTPPLTGFHHVTTVPITNTWFYCDLFKHVIFARVCVQIDIVASSK